MLVGILILILIPVLVLVFVLTLLLVLVLVLIPTLTFAPGSRQIATVASPRSTAHAETLPQATELGSAVAEVHAGV